MTSSTRTSSFVIGLVVGLTPLFAPIHEVAHVIIAGGDATITAWAHTEIPYQINQIHGAYLIELILWSWIGAALASVRPAVALFCLGHATGAFLAFYWSSDLWTYGAEVVERLGADPVVLQRIAIKWTWLGPLWLSGPVLIVRNAILREAQ